MGFLAYDLFGKIVERAVSLRLDSNLSHQFKGISRSNCPLLELTGGDQLEGKNIKQALAELDLKPLYSSLNINLGDSATMTQLYFGPGFEDRLELEMDELFRSKTKSLPEEEIKARKEEENLFSNLPETPALVNLMDVLENNPKDHTNDLVFSKKMRP